MRLCICFILGIIFNFINCFGQSPSFQEGDNVFAVGYGFGNYADEKADISDHSFATIDYSSRVGPIYFKYEHAVSSKMTLGINYANYKSVHPSNSKIYYNNNYVTDNITYFSWSALIRLNWHFGSDEKFDPYWGFGLGAKHTAENSSLYPADHNDDYSLGFETTIGGRYYISKALALYTEIGFAKSAIQFGIVYKI